MSSSTIKHIRQKLGDIGFKLKKGVFSRLGKKVPSLLARDKCGQLGIIGGAIGAVMTMAFITAVCVGILLVISHLIPWIVQCIAGSTHLITILVHVPQLQIGGMTYGASSDLPNFVIAASNAGGSLYSTFQMIAMAVLTIGFITIGLSYVLEQFNVMRPGTAEKFLSESALIIIFIFIFPYFYNAGAFCLNTVDEKVILSPTIPETLDEDDVQLHSPGDSFGPSQVRDDIAGAAGTVPGVFGDVPVLGTVKSWTGIDPSRAIIVIITMGASFMSALIAFSTGLFKVIATIGIAAAFPIVLAMRLIPFLRDVSSRLMSSLIGLMLASVVIAIFFRVGWEILVMTWKDELFRWAIGVALLMAAAGAFTITAPAMSGMSAEISGTLGRSTASALAGMGAMAGTAAVGGMVGTTLGGVGGLVGKGGGKMAGLKGAGRGLGKGLLRAGPGEDLGGAIVGGGEAGREAGIEARTMGAGDQKETNEMAHGYVATDYKEELDRSEKYGESYPTETGLKERGEQFIQSVHDGTVTDEELYHFDARARECMKPEEGARSAEAEMKKGSRSRNEIRNAVRMSDAKIKKGDDWDESKKDLLYTAYGKAITRSDGRKR